MKKHTLMLCGLLLSYQLQAQPAPVEAEEEADPAEIAIGERLTLETRFAQAYFAKPGQADPVLEKSSSSKADLRGPFAGKTMNCRSCHMVDEHAENPLAGMRSYSDYAARPPVPVRQDGAKTSVRNSMSMVNISISRKHGELFHFDGQFNSMPDLVKATLTGRNFGWLPSEAGTAIQHIARMIREDKGNDELAQEFGGSYRKVLKGTAADIPDALRLPKEYRVDVNKASDEQVVDAVARLISAYVTNLTFAMDDDGNYIASPYDVFLKKNGLPRKPASGESNPAYQARLLKAVEKLKSPRFVIDKDGKFASHQQKFVFAEKELQGMKLFFRQANSKQQGGNCASCHSAPHFSDFGFHNTGLSQLNYDALHGDGSFMKLAIPGLKKRNANYNDFLPATPKHPAAKSRFRAIASKNLPGMTDLGLWNVFANPDMPGPQQKLRAIMCEQARHTNKSAQCSDASLLAMTVAAFKTPLLRDLGHSAPYMHTGQFDSLQQAVAFYVSSSALAQQGKLRNADAAFKHMRLSGEDIEPLVAFIRSLNEDYE